MMNLDTLSTAALEKIAGRSAPGSKEAIAIANELKRRTAPSLQDNKTPLLFTASEFQKIGVKVRVP